MSGQNLTQIGHFGDRGSLQAYTAPGEGSRLHSEWTHGSRGCRIGRGPTADGQQLELHHPAFRAEMNRRRAEAYDQEVGRLRTLRESALQVVETALQNGSLRAALAVLRLITPPSAPTVDAVDPHKLVENEAASKALNDVLMPSISGPGDVKARERELRARLLEKL